MQELWKLFSAFFRIGILTFGGGYAMLPMLTREVVEKHAWATEAELLDCFAIGQCTPGVIAVNTATLVGHKQKGTVGGIVATLGVVSPSILIITLIASLLENYAHIPAVQHAFAGMRAAVAALIAVAVIKLFRSSVLAPAKEQKGALRFLPLAICLIAFALVALFGASPAFVAIGAALAGIAAGKWGANA